MNAVPYSHKGELVKFLNDQAGLDENKEKVTNDVLIFIDKVVEAQTFRLPHQESLPIVKDYKLFYEFMKAPYSSFLIEMPTDDGWIIMFVVSNADFKEDTKHLNKKITEFNTRKWWQLPKKKKERYVPDSISDFHCGIFHKKNDGRWVSWGAFDVDMDESGYEVTTKLEELSDDVNRRFAWTIFEFMVAVNTPNIKQSEVKPPKLINEKRKKKGKPLLEGYKYLDLIPREQLSHDATGTGQAKRMHWRRGHIRRLEDRTTWVRPALIGKGSFIDKTYRVNP